jgi:hypothetical protein
VGTNAKIYGTQEVEIKMVGDFTLPLNKEIVWSKLSSNTAINAQAPFDYTMILQTADFLIQVYGCNFTDSLHTNALFC